VVVDGHQVPARLQGGQVELEHLHPVGEQRGDDVAGLEIEAAQPVDHLVGPTEQFARGVLGAVRCHQRQVLRMLVRQCPEAEIAHVDAFPRVVDAVVWAAADPEPPAVGRHPASGTPVTGGAGVAPTRWGR
jgi:hypothetical protein